MINKKIKAKTNLFFRQSMNAIAANEIQLQKTSSK